MAALKVAVTGGIGSGKTSVAKLFAALGVTVIDADQIALQLTTENHDIIDKIHNKFGDKILTADNSINRSQLRSIIFQDRPAKQWLEKLLHPRIIKEMLNSAKKASSTYCLLVIPLLVEAKLTTIGDKILVIDAPENLQIARAKKRDQLPQQAIEEILTSQVNREQRLAIADDVLLNDGSLTSLATKVRSLHQKYLKFARDQENCQNS